MPLRQSPEKKVEGGPQGADAFIVVKRLTVEESNSFTEKFNQLQEDAVDAEARQNGELEARKSFGELVFDWNWVDNDGNPLPKPHNNPDVFGALYNEELEWITRAIVNNAPEQLVNAKKKHK